jgi:molybdenum cofactor guanylyltransferase
MELTGVSGAVLAGGRSSRFGSDKARFLWAGKPLLGHVLASMAELDERFVVANRPYPEFGVPVHADAGLGPLGGLVAALRAARNDWVALAACDLPCLTPAYWAALAARAPEAARAVGVTRAGRPEPLATLYHRALLPVLAARLAQRDLAMHPVLALPGAHLVPLEGLGLPESTLRNLNTPQEADLLSCDSCHPTQHVSP